MKSPLRYQITDFDCGSVSLINCLTYLFEREEVPAELVRIITTFSLECYNEKGMLENNAYTKQLNYVVSKWVSEFARQKMIPLKSLYLTGEKIGLSMIVGCLKREGCVNVKTYRDGYEHYASLYRGRTGNYLLLDIRRDVNIRECNSDGGGRTGSRRCGYGN